MRRLILGAILVIAAGPAAADVIRCVFTEPFITTSFDLSRGEMLVEDDLNHTRAMVRGLSLHLFRGKLFEIRDAGGRTVQHIEMTMAGSDGMSEAVYPYDAFWVGKGLRGGCTSEHLPMVKR